MKALAWVSLRWSTEIVGTSVQPELLGGQYAAVTGDHVALAVDQHRYDEAEGFDAARDLADLPWAVGARIIRIELQL